MNKVQKMNKVQSYLHLLFLVIFLTSVSQSEPPVSIRTLLPIKPIVPYRHSFLCVARNPGGPVRRLILYQTSLLISFFYQYFAYRAFDWTGAKWFNKGGGGTMEAWLKKVEE